MHDPRCPVCRTVLATKVAPPTTQNVLNIEFTLNDVNAAIDDDYRALRRQQINYDARRRRFLRRNPALQDEDTAVRTHQRELREIDRRLAQKWSRESHALWMGSSFAEMRRERSLLLRRMRRRERIVERAVSRQLGDRPDIDVDDSSSLTRALARLGRSWGQQRRQGPQIVSESESDSDDAGSDAT